MGDIIIAGGGFAGLAAARLLAKNRARLDNRRIIIVDSKKTSDFLPLLPDVVSGRVRKGNAAVVLADYLADLRLNFERAEISRIDTGSKEVFLKEGGVLAFEFLILACGTQTDFYGQADLQRRSLKLDSVEDAMVLANVVGTYPKKKIVIVGGGYTGVEIASHLALLLKKKKLKKYSVNIVERQEDILTVLPEGMRDYCRLNLCRLKVNVLTSCSVASATDERLKLSNGLEFEDYLLVWSAGVQTSACVRGLDADKDRQGRLRVDATLAFAPGCFAVGDDAAFRRKGEALRMAVPFSIAQAQIAAANILRMAAKKKHLKKYRPVDLGYFVPMANRRACGKVFFFRLSGFPAWVLHYVMCVYRSLTRRTKMGVFFDLLFR